MIGRQMVADNCETVWTIVVVEVLVRQIRFRLGIHYSMYFLGRLNVIESSTCAPSASEYGFTAIGMMRMSTVEYQTVY